MRSPNGLRISIKCQGCGKEILAAPSAATKQKFCSRKCTSANYPKGIPKTGKLTKVVEERKCLACSTLFSCHPNSKAKYCNRKCYMSTKKGKPVLSTEQLQSIDRSYMQTEEYRSKMRKHDASSYRAYANRVHKLTKHVYNENIDLLNPDRLPRRLCGTPGGYQLDHIFPIRLAFEQNWLPEKVAEVTNLRLITWEENIKKGHKYGPLV